MNNSSSKTTRSSRPRSPITVTSPDMPSGYLSPQMPMQQSAAAASPVPPLHHDMSGNRMTDVNETGIHTRKRGLDQVHAPEAKRMNVETFGQVEKEEDGRKEPSLAEEWGMYARSNAMLRELHFLRMVRKDAHHKD